MCNEVSDLFHCVSLVEEFGTGSIASILGQVEGIKSVRIMRFYGSVWKDNREIESLNHEIHSTPIFQHFT